MTFTNKISKLIYTYTKYYNSNLVKEIEKESDNFSIEFAEWLLHLQTKEKLTELLKEFKQEKNL